MGDRGLEKGAQHDDASPFYAVRLGKIGTRDSVAVRPRGLWFLEFLAYVASRNVTRLIKGIDNSPHRLAKYHMHVLCRGEAVSP